MEIFYKFKFTMFIEIMLRVFLWTLFLCLDRTEPFIREIKDNELWKYQYPITPSYIPSFVLYIIIFLTPILFCLLEYELTKNHQNVISYILGVTLSYGLTGVLTTYLKVLVGRPRPDFYYRCFPSGTGTNVKSCDGERRSYMDGRTSFPSGHSSFAFACMTFLSLYLARKFCLFEENKKGHGWQLCVCFLPIIVAAAIAISRTCDYHHHYEDAAFGSLLGTVVSYLCFKLYFPRISISS